MSASIRTLSFAGLLLAAVSAIPAAHAHAGPVADRWDHRGDRIDARLDLRGDRVDGRLDHRADLADANGRPLRAERLDRKGDRIDHRLDLRGDSLDRRFDRIGQRRQARRG